jgi:ABC-type transport system substrate-binding protein
MKKPFTYACGVLAIAIFCLCGCGKNTETISSGAAPTNNYPLPDPPVVVNCTPGIRGGQFVLGELREPKTFNYLIADDLSSIYVGRLMFWRLLNFDVPTQTVKPGLAVSWTNSPDGKTWTFKLRKNLFWSDGIPLTADDVVFTWNDVIYNPAIPNPVRDEFIINGKKFTVTKLDDWTVQVTTRKSMRLFCRPSATMCRFIPNTLLKSMPTPVFRRPTALIGIRTISFATGHIV